MTITPEEIEATCEKYAPEGYDPACDDMTIPFAMELVRKDAKIYRLSSVNADLLAALRFYADSRRYEGGNRQPLEDDPHQPIGLVYRLDVTRDHGRIAAAAIRKAETE